MIGPRHLGFGLDDATHSGRVWARTQTRERSLLMAQLTREALHGLLLERPGPCGPSYPALLPALTDDGRFFVLAFSEAGYRLLDATRHNFHEVEVPGVPRTGSELLEDDAEGERRRSDMTPTSSGQNRGHPFFGGMGVTGS